MRFDIVVQFPPIQIARTSDRSMSWVVNNEDSCEWVQCSMTRLCTSLSAYTQISQWPKVVLEQKPFIVLRDCCFDFASWATILTIKDERYTHTDVYISHLMKSKTKNRSLIIQAIRNSLRDTIFFQRTQSVFRIITNANDTQMSSKIVSKVAD